MIMDLMNTLIDRINKQEILEFIDQNKEETIYLEYKEDCKYLFGKNSINARIKSVKITELIKKTIVNIFKMEVKLEKM